ncbi:MAG: MFS transporter [Burkholderiaceae bacterium]
MTDFRIGRRERIATRITFLVAGIAMSAWAPLVPLAKARTGLDEASLGLVLLCFGCGSLVAMPLAGLTSAKFGSRLVIFVAVMALVTALPLLAIVDRPIALAAALLVFGAGLGALDVAMNLQAIAVERASGRAMMSGFHGLFSAGGIVGASGVALALSAGIDATVVIALLALLLAIAIGTNLRGLLADATRDRTTTFALPHGVVLVIGLLAAAAFLVEGAVLDWGALFMTTVRDVSVARASAGYIAFSIAMTAGRFGGDRVVQRFGGRRVLVAGALCSALGVAIVVLLPPWSASLAGFALIGVGASNIVPVLFTAAGSQTAMPPSLAVPAMTTMGYAGLLAGPALIGFAAQASSLSIALFTLVPLLLAVALVGRTLKA